MRLPLKLYSTPYKPLYKSLLTSLGCLSLLSACGSYEWKLNDKLVYSPPALFQDYNKSDPALSHCLQQAIHDQDIRRPQDLLELHCGPGEIQQLNALASFPSLVKLVLAGNQITKLGALEQLTELELLDLSHNQLESAAPLANLSKLKQVSLIGNDTLRCESLNAVKATTENTPTILVPEHCQ